MRAHLPKMQTPYPRAAAQRRVRLALEEAQKGVKRHRRAYTEGRNMRDFFCYLGQPSTRDCGVMQGFSIVRKWTIGTVVQRGVREQRPKIHAAYPSGAGVRGGRFESAWFRSLGVVLTTEVRANREVTVSDSLVI